MTAPPATAAPATAAPATAAGHRPPGRSCSVGGVPAGLAAWLGAALPSQAELARLSGLDAAGVATLAGLLARVHAAAEAEAAAWRAREQQLREQAHTDALTGLANRAGLQAAAAAVFTRSAGGRVGGLLADLDRFKPVNDTHGHHTGDQVLTHAAARLHAAGGVGGTAARLGGDEFVLLLPALPADPAAAARRTLHVATALATALAAPYQLAGGLVLEVGASIGAATVPAVSTLPTLLGAADLAMYAAKAAGGGIRYAPDPPPTAAAQPAPPRRAGRLRDRSTGQQAAYHARQLGSAA